MCEAAQLVGRDMVQSVQHQVAGEVKFVARPIRFDDAPPAPSTAPPLLGQHTVDVFSEWLGWSVDSLQEFCVAGAFGRPPVGEQSAE